MAGMATDGLQAGFANAVRDSQHVFRQCLHALSRPGVSVSIDVPVEAMPPVHSATAAVLLGLADFETSVWLDEKARRAPGFSGFLRFHTGARTCETPELADFAVVLDASGMPALSAFKQGTPEYPDRSTTLLIQVDALLPHGPHFTGPGINGATSFWAEPLPVDFAAQIVANRAAFPCGVDLLLISPTEMIGLPRSSAIEQVRGA